MFVFAHLLTVMAMGPADLPRRGMLGLSLGPLPPEVAAQSSIKDGMLITAPPMPSATGAKAGIQLGDIVLTINGQPFKPEQVAPWVRKTPAGTETTFELLRDGKRLSLHAPLQEKPRDPGNDRFKVRYGDVNTVCGRMRTIITEPTRAGKHPGILFIQGYSPISYDYILANTKGDATSIDGPLLFDLANSDFVTERVEKPGVGDSEGGPYADIDFTDETDIYRQALKQLRENANVDPDQLFIFGHSMGGAFGPVIAAETPVKGMAMYGVATRNWYQYFLDTTYSQDLLGGATFGEADKHLREGAQLFALVMLENKSPAEVKSLHPELAALTDSIFPDGQFNQKSLTFWRQLCQSNFPALWEKVNCHALAVHGSSDFVTYDQDHKLIADIVNHAHPGWGKWQVLPNADHLFHRFATQAESQKNFSRGTFTNEFSKVLKDWIGDVMTGKA